MRWVNREVVVLVVSVARAAGRRWFWHSGHSPSTLTGAQTFLCSLCLTNAPSSLSLPKRLSETIGSSSCVIIKHHYIRPARIQPGQTWGKCRWPCAYNSSTREQTRLNRERMWQQKGIVTSSSNFNSIVTQVSFWHSIDTSFLLWTDEYCVLSICVEGCCYDDHPGPRQNTLLLLSCTYVVVVVVGEISKQKGWCLEAR